ncbi:VOC family protein [Deinococcus misasensis]|uniref:VOC family protein n=1 Tax=Deinococcus misasensis TaxID=392413 RepID=UPI000553E5A5|nr:VOC family protein [Deinococcus misasensis]
MKFSHVALNCKDVDATIDFYSSIFGFHTARSFDLENGGKIVFLKLGDSYLELFPAEGTGDTHQADGPKQQGVLRHIAFQVDSVDQVLETIGDRAEVTLGPLDFDAFIPGWRTVWVRDPDGNIVEISQGYQDAQ